MKKIVPVLIILLALGIGGYFFMNSKEVLPKTPIGTTTGKTESTNVFTSIKDALSKSLSLKCVYKDEQGIQTTTYIKGGAVRVSMEGVKEKEQPNSIILKDKKMYMWNEISKTGFTFVMNEPKISPVQNEKLPKANINKDESLLAGIEKYKNSCKTEIIADSFFVPPTDVKFQNMDVFQKQMMKGIPANPPTNNGSTADQQKALEELMKQITPAEDGQ